MYKILKRIFDILFSVVFLIVFSPIYVLTAIMIIICSPGNPIYRAKRVGIGGRVFTCYKFRSMRVDSGSVGLTTLKNDQRVFGFGQFIRKTKIDEMPQVFNILVGDMSVVGPRPEDLINADKVYVNEFVHILDVKPGLTSIASLYDFTHGENYESEELYETEFLPKKMKLELYYVKHQTFFYDIFLILKTALLIVLKFFGKKKFKEPKELNWEYDNEKI